MKGFGQAPVRRRPSRSAPLLLETVDYRMSAKQRVMPKADQSSQIAPEAIARLILFLVGPDVRIISGAHLPV